MSRTRIGVVLALMCSGGTACGIGQTVPYKNPWKDFKGGPPQPLTALEGDPARDQLLEQIPDQDPMEEAKDHLLKALKGSKVPEGVDIREPATCSAAGCRVDVVYANEDAFLAFEEGKFHKPDSDFEKWNYGNGRTALLRNKEGQLVATWFFMARRSDYKTWRHQQ
jgi:hypothetical protein